MKDNPYSPPQEFEPSDEAKSQDSNGIPVALTMLVGGIIVGLINGASESSLNTFGFKLVFFSSLGLVVGIGYLVFRWCYLWIAERLDEL